MLKLRTSIENNILWRYDPQVLILWIITVMAGVGSGVVAILATGGIISDERFTAISAGLLFLPIILALVGNLRYWLLAIWILDIPYSFDIYFQQSARLSTWHIEGAVNGLNLSLSTLAIIVLYGWWILDLLINRKPTKLKPAFGQIWVVLPFVGLSVLSYFYATDPSITIFESGILIQMALIFLYLVGTLRTKREFVFILVMMLIALFAESAYTIINTFLLGGGEGGSTRAVGHFGSPNTTGGYLSVMSIMALSVVAMPLHKYIRGFAAFALFFGVVTVLLTQSRGGWIALGLGIGLFIMAMVLRKWISVSIPLLVIIVGVCVALAFPDLIINRLFGDDEGAAASRGPLNQIAFTMIADYPIFGVGSNNFSTVMPGYLVPKFNGAWLYTVHNRFVLIWTELGTVGISFYFLMLGVTIFRGIRVWLLPDRFYAMMGLALTVSVLGHMTHALFDVFTARAVVQMLWIQIALINALYIGQVKLK